MKKIILLLSVLLFTIALSASVMASEAISITDIENVDGKIGLYIRNDVGLTMFTDNSEKNTSVLNYYLDDVKLLSIPSESAVKILTEQTKLVVIDKVWPTTQYSKIKVVFTDVSGMNYEPEYGYVFAKQGLSLVESWTEPKMVTSNSSFTLYLKVRASGEERIKDIGISTIANPKYYTFVSNTENPINLNQDDTATYSFTYKLSGQSIPETIIYETVSAPILFNYKYLNQSTKTKINESVIIYSRLKVEGLLPVMKSMIDVPNTVTAGKIITVPIYVWNSLSGSHSACNLNLTLEETSGKFSIPIPHILPGETFAPATDQSSEPTANFEVTIPESVLEGDYTFKLSGTFSDCEWSAPGLFDQTKTVSVVKPTAIDNSSKLPAEKIDAETGEVIEETKIIDPTSSTTKYLIGGVLLIAIIVSVVFFLEKRGRRI